MAAAKKSDPKGGIRSKKRHAVEGGVAASLAVFVVSFFPEGSLGLIQVGSLTAIMTAGFSWVAKLMNENDSAGRVLKNVFHLSLVAILFSGCAVQIGTSTPHQFTSADVSKVIIACDLKGIQLTFGDADICRNIEGGHISEGFAGVITSTVDAAVRVVAGIFTGLGGVGAALAPGSPSE